MDTTALDRFQMHGQDIPRLLDHWATHKPDHAALVWAPREGAGQRWTYAELRRDVRRIAAGLGARGVGVGDKVLIHAENCPEMVLAWLGCAVLGAVGVTTNTKSVGAEMTYFAEHTGAVAALTQPQYAAMVAEAAPALRWIAVTPDNSGEAPSDEQAAAAAGFATFADLFGDEATFTDRDPDPMLPFGIMFTSGTTSRPKAVVHTHANAVWASRIGPRNIDLTTDDTYLIYPPFFHVNAQSWSFFAVLGVGATAVLMPKWSQSNFWPVVVDNGVTHVSVMPFAMGALGNPERPKDHKLRVGVFGLIMPDLDRMFGIGVYAAYGMTETVTHAITGKPAERLPVRSMGHVTPGYEIAVVDKETGELCAEGETGELWLRGTRGIQLFLEYYANPEANAKAFEDGWFKTGDMVKMGPGGNVFYQERDKDLLKVGGENVSAKEVEDLVVAHPAVQSVAVVGKTHDFLNEVAVAFVIPTAGDHDRDAVAAEIIDTCKQKLATFKVPRAVYFVDSFPT
ncbi:MAG: AMP-binding protein, partial [Acidimicrobiales bacterium]|nr:AMP-binding protein [Acidimicrobiales bacterium]